MNSKKAKICSLLLSAVMTLSLVYTGSIETYAKDNWSVWMNSTMFKGQTSSVTVGNNKSSKTGTVTSVKSSNKSVLKVVKTTSGSDKWYEVKAKKTGKAKLTIEFKTDSGKKKTLTKKITVKKYPNQIKSLTLNGKKIEVSKNKYKYSRKCSKTEATIKIKLKEGWEISDVNANLYNSENSKYEEVKSAKKKVKNGKAFSFPKDYDNLNVYIYMAREDQSISYHVNFRRSEKSSDKGKWTLRVSDTLFVGQQKTLTVGNTKSGKTAKIISVKSSDKSILKVKKKKSGSDSFYLVTPKKAGKAKLTVGYKVSGKKKTIKKTITVKKYPNEIKKLVLNDKEIDVSKHKYSYARKCSGKKAKIEIKLKEGWEIYNVNAVLVNSDTDLRDEVKDAKDLVKKGKEISFPKKYKNLNVNIYMSKDDKYISYFVNFHR